MPSNYGLGDLQAADTTVLSTAVTVTNAATALPTTALAQRKSVYVFNNAAVGGQTVYIGSSAVTAAGGTPVPPQSGVGLDLGAHVSLNGITSTGTADVRVLEIA